MTRYFFHLNDGTVVRDDQGMELPDVIEARRIAIVEAREIAAQDVRSGKLNLRYWIEVENEEREVVFTLPFSSAVQIQD